MILNQGGGGIVPKKVIDTTTITPTTTEQVIDAQTYLRGDVTIDGEPNLVPENIPIDISMFGVQGTKKLDILNGSSATITAGETIESGNFITLDYKETPKFVKQTTAYTKLIFPESDLQLDLSLSYVSSPTTTITGTLYRLQGDGTLTTVSGVNIPAISNTALGSDYSSSAYVTQAIAIDSKRFALIYSQCSNKTADSAYTEYCERKTGISIYCLNGSNVFVQELAPTRLPNTWWDANTSIEFGYSAKVTGILPYSNLDQDKKLIVFLNHVSAHDQRNTPTYGYSIIDYTKSPATVTNMVPTTHSIYTATKVSYNDNIGLNYKDENGNYHIISLCGKLNDTGNAQTYCWAYIKITPLEDVTQLILSPVTEIQNLTNTNQSRAFIDMFAESNKDDVRLRIAYWSIITGINVSEINGGFLGVIELSIPHSKYVPTIISRNDKVALSYPMVSLADRARHNYSSVSYSSATFPAPCDAFFLNKECLLVAMYTETYSGLPKGTALISVGFPFSSISHNFKPRIIDTGMGATYSTSFGYVRTINRNMQQTLRYVTAFVSRYSSGSGVVIWKKENILPKAIKCTTEGNYDVIDGISTSSAEAGRPISIMGLKEV